MSHCEISAFIIYSCTADGHGLRHRSMAGSLYEGQKFLNLCTNTRIRNTIPLFSLPISPPPTTLSSACCPCACIISPKRESLIRFGSNPYPITPVGTTAITLYIYRCYCPSWLPHHPSVSQCSIGNLGQEQNEIHSCCFRFGRSRQRFCCRLQVSITSPLWRSSVWFFNAEPHMGGES